MMCMKRFLRVGLYSSGLLTFALLTGCGRSTVGLNKTSSSSEIQSSSQISSEPFTESTKEVSSSQSTARTEDKDLWNEGKAQDLRDFMVTWGQEMNQTYQEYGPGNDVDLYGLKLPDDVISSDSTWKAALNNEPLNLKWSTDGHAGDSYALVAVYSDAATMPYLKKHVYFFTVEEGVPKVFVTMQNQGNEDNYLNLSETENEALKAYFTRLVTAS
ncbi:DUF4767 domain-containing protein [Streptococcaceae bacterium ESL0729]|nr:DUF4767 domain-containing protein [Streptococcaceae bacterium ESL0729]